ncbi:hypothetical protein NE852_20200 [Rhizobium sp. Pop5]|uniref:hypothetical protein n=1 Tax=Rhizobium sp. Pop5 TaxID=1223565 RepID=UPI000283BB08|nr:hypothetical protein [Rhizobium sp. Pop5]EJZ21108.1 hypothetical protein RCCGEPOP_11703 [Rhizobium sp. Pop5]UVD56364.1 hypothetical protein NE852_20200 [Rhizobium sp. Pop5]
MSTIDTIFLQDWREGVACGSANFDRLPSIKLMDYHAHIFYLESFKNLGLLPQLMLKQRGKH